MPRIRTVKPELFRHEILQDLQKQRPELQPMMVFIALFGHCDKQGVFEWRPRQLALDILPFLWEGNIGETIDDSLMFLAENGMIESLFSGEKRYGFIPTFIEHQRITGREAQEPSKMPQVSEMTREPQRGNNAETIGKHRGNIADDRKGREGKGREIEEGDDTRPRKCPPGFVHALFFQTFTRHPNGFEHPVLAEMQAHHPRDALEHAFRQAGENGAKSLKYVVAVLQPKETKPRGDALDALMEEAYGKEGVGEEADSGGLQVVEGGEAWQCAQVVGQGRSG